MNTQNKSVSPSGISPETTKRKLLLVSAEMGYGHNRAIYPLADLSEEGKIVDINEFPDSSLKEIKLWRKSLRSYEFLSRAGKFPLIGQIISTFLDILLQIPEYYPIRDRSRPTLQARYLLRTIRNGLCDGLIRKIKKDKVGVLTSFYIPALAAELRSDVPVYCIICDTDLSRVWVPLNVHNSRIIYFAPGTTAVKRLISYGVSEQNIVLTGFPLPVELLGTRDFDVLKRNLKRRLKHLDPSGAFYRLYQHSIDAYLDNSETESDINTSDSKLTITFAVGGAGAQKETGRKIAESLASQIINGEIRLNLIAGTRPELKSYFETVKNTVCTKPDGINVIWRPDFGSYYREFNLCLHTTDILWTKPSELSFYCALGLPIIITDAIGPQEKCNQKWLYEIGAGVKQQNPDYTNQWLFDLIDKGRIAEKAWNGFLKARKNGTFNITGYLDDGIVYSDTIPSANDINT